MPERVGKGRAVQVSVATLAAGFGHEQAGVAGGAMERAIGSVRFVVGAQRIGAAEGGPIDRPSQDRTELGSLAEMHKPAECAFGVGRRRVEEDAGHRLRALTGRPAVDPFAQRRR